ncbi:uroporphyrinogen decarboxylase family protein [bacterium]|nr:uroporphyrinogen decarboxylase family protein [bacterium]
MTALTGKERIKSAYKRTFVDRIPFYPISGAFTAKIVNSTVSRYLQDVETFVHAQFEYYQRYKPDVVVMLADLLIEAEAMGARLRFPENSICETEEYLLADKGQLKRLGVPDPSRDGRMPYFIEACQQISKEIGDSAVGSTICGPWAVAGALRGIEALIYDTMDDPDFVHRLMELTTLVVIEFASAVRETGVGISLSEAPTSCSLISPDIYKEFIEPYYRKLVSVFKEKKTGLTIHICGYIDPIMTEVSQCGFSAISFDSPSSLAKMVEDNQGRCVLIGNISTSLFGNAQLEDMETSIRTCLETAAAGSGYILSSGCEVPLDSPLESLDFFMNTAQRYCSEYADRYRK